MLIRKILILLIITFFKTNFSFSQRDSLIILNQKITYYINDKKNELITYSFDTCEYTDDLGLNDYKDNCRTGLYRKWYINGQLKTIGQYSYELYTDTIFVFNKEKGDNDTVILSKMKSGKIGLWTIFDSLEKRVVTKRYYKDRLLAESYPFHDTIISIKSDSFKIKLKDYSISSFVINRAKNNVNFVIQFPVIYGHSYWKILDHRIDLLYDEYPTKGLYDWEKGIADFAVDDCCGTNCRDSYDFAKLPWGRYYVYYWSFNGQYHETEIILNEK